VAGSRQYDIDGIKDACAQMPDGETAQLCLEGATWLTAAQPEYKDAWQELCEPLAGEYKTRCLNSKHLI
jgi:hypothetical protein